MRAYARPPSGRDLLADLLAFKVTALFKPKIGTKLAAKYHTLPVLKPPSMSLLKLGDKLRGRHRGVRAESLNSELIIEKLGPISSDGGICAIIHILTGS